MKYAKDNDERALIGDEIQLPESVAHSKRGRDRSDQGFARKLQKIPRVTARMDEMSSETIYGNEQTGGFRDHGSQCLLHRYRPAIMVSTASPIRLVSQSAITRPTIVATAVLTTLRPTPLAPPVVVKPL